MKEASHSRVILETSLGVYQGECGSVARDGQLRDLNLFEANLFP